MDKKDVAGITLKSFTKKWWDWHRSSKIKGTGTGAQLDSWRKECPEDVSTLTVAALDKADTACVALRKSFQAALTKCTKDTPDDTAGIKKMLSLLEGYETALANRRKAVTNDAMSLADNIGDILAAIVQQTVVLKKVRDEVRDMKDRAVSYEKRAPRAVTNSAKGQLIDLINSERQSSEQLEKQATKATAVVKNVEQPYKKAIDEARTDPRYRALIQNYDAKRKEFDELYADTTHKIGDCGLDLTKTFKDLSNTATADKDLETLRTQVTMLEMGPGLDRYAAVMDLIKRSAGEIVKANQAPEGIPESGWKKVIELETEFEDEMKSVPDTDNTIARMMKMVKEIGTRFKGVAEIDEQVKEANRISALRLKERTDLMKFAPVFRKQLRDLIAKMPEKVN